MKKFEFAGIIGSLNEEEVKVKWEHVMENHLETIKRYKHDDDELSHEYFYGIEIIDLESACGEEGFEVVLYYVVSPKSICGKIKDNVMEQFDDDFDEDYISWFDIMQEGGAVQLGHKWAKDDEELDDVLLEAMASADAIDGLRGFYLDRPWNMIGTTGWDNIKFALGLQDRLFNF